MRIGLFGGSFDPPHRGHLAVAEAVRQAFALDRVLLAPAAIQPLKPEGAHAPFADRLRMVELLCADSPGLEASAIDAPRPDGAPNYTIDSIRALRAEFGSSGHPQAELFIIVGADAFLGIRQWKDSDALLREARWIIVGRPGFDLRRLDALALTPAQRGQIETLPDLAVPVSATEIRELLEDRRAAAELMPANVVDYIHAQHLYGT